MYVVCLHMHCRWRSNFQEEVMVISFTGYPRNIVVPDPSQDVGSWIYVSHVIRFRAKYLFDNISVHSMYH